MKTRHLSITFCIRKFVNYDTVHFTNIEIITHIALNFQFNDVVGYRASRLTVIERRSVVKCFEDLYLPDQVQPVLH